MMEIYDMKNIKTLYVSAFGMFMFSIITIYGALACDFNVLTYNRFINVHTIGINLNFFIPLIFTIYFVYKFLKEYVNECK